MSQEKKNQQLPVGEPTGLAGIPPLALVVAAIGVAILGFLGGFLIRITPEGRLTGQVDITPTVLISPSPTHEPTTEAPGVATVATELPATEQLPVSGTTICPSLTEARQLFGVDVTLVGGESCAFTFNTGDDRFILVHLPPGWYITTAEADGYVYVQEGAAGYSVEAKAATFRFKAAYPELSLNMQYQLTVNFASLPQNAFADRVRCRGCVELSNPPSQPTAAPVGMPCPNVTGFTSSPIEGGCVYRAATPSTFVVPWGWKAYYGQPPQWVEAGTIHNVTQVSLYPSH